MKEHNAACTAVVALRHGAARTKALPSENGFRPDPRFRMTDVVVAAVLVVIHGMDRHSDLASVTNGDMDRIIVVRASTDAVGVRIAAAQLQF